MIKKLSCFLLAFVLLFSLGGCGRKQRQSETYIEYFDTAVTLMGYDDSERFSELSLGVEELLKKYHRLFDIYNTYEGVNNLCTINENAGKNAVVVEQDVIDFLAFCQEAFAFTNGETNVMLGSVLKMWHECRNSVSSSSTVVLPSKQALTDAAEHTNIDLLAIDDTANTVYIVDKDASLDVGAVAKGYVADVVVNFLVENGAENYALNMGGMVCCVGDADGRPWSVGIIDPTNTSQTALTVNLTEYCLVTSGVYQRYFDLDGKRYHHIIDKDSLYPEDRYLSVSVLCPDAAVGDALSTALFNMSLEDGKKLLQENEDISALWILPDGSQEFGGKFEDFIK